MRIALNAAPDRAVFAPGGRYEHLPLAVVELPRVTIERLGQAAAELGRAVHGGTAVGEAVADFAADWCGRTGEVTAAGLVEGAARLHGVCDLAWGLDEQQIARRLDQAGGDGASRIVLDAIEEGSYQRIRDRLVAMWHDFDPLARWMYSGRDPREALIPPRGASTQRWVARAKAGRTPMSATTPIAGGPGTSTVAVWVCAMRW